MNSLKTPLRRAAAIVAGSLVGLAGIVAVASPSVADPGDQFTVTVAGEPCNRPGGGWKVNWTVTSSQTDEVGTVTNVVFRPVGESTMTGIEDGATVPVAGDGPLAGTQTVEDDFQFASLRVQVTWDNPDGESWIASDLVVVPRGRKNGNGCAVTSSPSPSPSETTSATPTPTPTETSASPTPTPTATTSPTPTPTVTTSPTPTPTATTTPTPTPTTSTSTPPTGDSASWFYDDSCDTITVGISVPASWDDLTVTFTPSTGAAKTVTAPAGTETSVDFPAAKGLTVKASAKGYEDEDATIKYTAPSDCSGGGGGLPVTGAAAGSIAAGAVVLLGIGGFLFFMARRRKVKFTA